jgi:hypothetical protein
MITDASIILMQRIIQILILILPTLAGGYLARSPGLLVGYWFGVILGFIVGLFPFYWIINALILTAIAVGLMPDVLMGSIAQGGNRVSRWVRE